MLRGQDTLDARPGPIPEIRARAGDVTFEMHPVGTRNGERLVIRCDDDGDVWISIQSDVSDNS